MCIDMLYILYETYVKKCHKLESQRLRMRLASFYIIPEECHIRPACVRGHADGRGRRFRQNPEGQCGAHTCGLTLYLLRPQREVRMRTDADGASGKVPTCGGKYTGLPLCLLCPQWEARARGRRRPEVSAKSPPTPTSPLQFPKTCVRCGRSVRGVRRGHAARGDSDAGKVS